MVPWEVIKNANIDDTSAGTPTQIAWETASLANVHPINDTSRVLKIQWWQPFASWTAGAATATLNLPDDVLLQLCVGAAADLLSSQSEYAALAAPLTGQYMAFEQRMRGAGGMGVKVIDRNSIE
jgi:hypothetical protein